MGPSLYHHMEYFHCLKNSLCSICVDLSFLTNLWQQLIFSIVLPFSECHTIGIIHLIAFSNWLLPISNMYLSSSMSFHTLIADFILLLNNDPFSGCTSVYPFTYRKVTQLLPGFGSYKQNCQKYLYGYLCKYQGM